MNNNVLKLALNEGDLSFAKAGNCVFDDIVNAAADIEKSSLDVYAESKDVQFTAQNENTDYYNMHIYVNGFPKSMPLSDWGLSQLCQHYNVPASFIRKYIELGTPNAIEEACDILRFWQSQRERYNDLFLRTTDNRVHGVLSSRYSVYDDVEFLEEIKNAMPEVYNMKIMNKIVSPDITKMRVVSEDKFHIAGDDLSIGFDISNSRVGRSSVKVQFMMFRWICSNGMIIGGGKADMFMSSHRGVVDATELKTLITRTPEFLNYVKEWGEKAAQNKINSQTLDLLIAQFKNKFNSETAVNNIIDVMHDKYDQTYWGFGNAITEVAQSYNVFVREQLERYAGDIIRRAA